MKKLLLVLFVTFLFYSCKDENPIVSEAVSNLAPRPFGKFGSVRRKRTHVKLVARSKGEKK